MIVKRRRGLRRSTWLDRSAGAPDRAVDLSDNVHHQTGGIGRGASEHEGGQDTIVTVVIPVSSGSAGSHPWPVHWNC